jgi:hypothetical protein
MFSSKEAVFTLTPCSCKIAVSMDGQELHYMEPEDPSAVDVKFTIFWDLTP